MLILAIDPSINTTGWALLDSGKIAAFGAVNTRKKGTIVERLLDLHDGIDGVIAVAIKDNKEISNAVVEVPGAFSYKRSISPGGNPMNVQSLMILSEAVGCICATIGAYGIPVTRILASAWKCRRTKALDKGIASSIVGQAVSDDEADAILLALYCEKRIPWIT